MSRNRQDSYYLQKSKINYQKGNVKRFYGKTGICYNSTT